MRSVTRIPSSSRRAPGNACLCGSEGTSSSACLCDSRETPSAAHLYEFREAPNCIRLCTNKNPGKHPYGSRNNPGSMCLYGSMGNTRRRTLLRLWEKSGNVRLSSAEKKISEAKPAPPCRNQAICRQAPMTIVIRNSLNASI